MKSNVKSSRYLKVPPSQRRSYWSVICAASLTCGMIAEAQTNNPPATNSVTTNVMTLRETTVIGQLDKSRSQIMPDLGATYHTGSLDDLKKALGFQAKTLADGKTQSPQEQIRSSFRAFSCGPATGWL